MTHLAEVDRLLTLDETAERINRSPSALRNMVQKGTAPLSAKFGGRRMFRESDIDAWIEEAFAVASECGSGKR